jgi:hypothetical protein
MWWIVMAWFFLHGGISWLMELQGLEVYGYDALVDGYEMLLGLWYIFGGCCHGCPWTPFIMTLVYGGLC